MASCFYCNIYRWVHKKPKKITKTFTFAKCDTSEFGLHDRMIDDQKMIDHQKIINDEKKYIYDAWILLMT